MSPIPPVPVWRLLRLFLIPALVSGGLWSCIPQKNLLLMQYDEAIDSTYALTFEGKEFADTVYRILPNDYLYINVGSVEKPITQVVEPLAGVNYLNQSNQALLGYHVQDDGTIFFPYVGYIKLGGLTINEARDTLRIKLANLVGRSRIEIALVNNIVYMLGEFNEPGTFNMTRNKLGIFEAITLAHGLTDYAKRDKIKILRMENGKRKLYLVDLCSGNLIAKNMFYVYPNDVVYAEPMRAKSFGITPTFSLGILSAFLSLAVVLTTLVP